MTSSKALPSRSDLYGCDSSYHAFHTQDTRDFLNNPALSPLPFSTSYVSLKHFEDERHNSISEAHGLQRNVNLFVTPKGNYNIHRSGGIRHQFKDLLLRDKFHLLLSFNMATLLPLVFVSYIILAVALSLLLSIVTNFDVRGCLGGSVSNPIHFYFFTVETMFAIGFGSPRYPSCTESNWMVTVIVVSTCIFNSLVFGIVFAKFSSGSRRQFDVSFSSFLVAAPSTVAIASHRSNHFCAPSVPVSSKEEHNFPNLVANHSTVPADTKNERDTTGRQTSKIPYSILNEPSVSPSASMFSPAHSINKPYRLRVTHAGAELDVEKPESSRINPRGVMEPFKQSFGFDPTSEEQTPLESRSSNNIKKSHSSETEGMLSSESDKQHVSSDPVDDYFILSFRLMNLTDHPVFNTNLSLFLLTHTSNHFEIARIKSYYSDVPIEFIELPTTISIDSRDLVSSHYDCIAMKKLQNRSGIFEILALLTFTDGRTSRTIEIRKSWKLDQILWNHRFVDVVRRDPVGNYIIDSQQLDCVQEIKDE